MTEYKGNIVPIEVKSAERTKAKSLTQFITRYKPKYAFKVSLKNVGDNMIKETHLYSIPLYGLFRIRDYMDAEE